MSGQEYKMSKMEQVAKFYRLFIFDNHKIPKKIRDKKLFTFYHPEINRISEDKISINIIKFGYLK